MLHLIEMEHDPDLIPVAGTSQNRLVRFSVPWLALRKDRMQAALHAAAGPAGG